MGSRLGDIWGLEWWEPARPILPPPAGSKNSMLTGPGWREDEKDAWLSWLEELLKEAEMWGG